MRTRPARREDRPPGLPRRADRIARSRQPCQPTFGDHAGSGVSWSARHLPPGGATGASPARRPDTGTATRVGGAGGFFRHRYGSNWTDVEAPVDVEEFTGTIAITADFADQTVRGCIGCVGDLELEREHLYGVLGFRRREPLALPTDYELHFGATDIYSNGAFVNDDVTVTHPERSVTESSGCWDGRLSNRPDTDGNPRLVAGSAAVEFVEADGSVGEFRSLFTALGEGLLPPAPNPDP